MCSQKAISITITENMSLDLFVGTSQLCGRWDEPLTAPKFSFPHLFLTLVYPLLLQRILGPFKLPASPRWYTGLQELSLE